MLDTDVVVVESDRLVLREGENALGAVVETIEGAHRNAEPTARSVACFLLPLIGSSVLARSS